MKEETMFRIRNPKLFVFMIGLVFAYTAFASGLNLDDILKAIQSKDFSQRRHARESLGKYLESISESQRNKDVKQLLDSFTLPSSSYYYKLGICEGIGKMRKASWEVENQEETEKKLYALFKKEKNNTLKRSIDDALMTARGLYWDAIHDYNNDRVDQPDSVTKKFQRVFHVYPASRRAPGAHFYLARYYTRAYFILKAQNKKPAPGVWIEKSNDAFKGFISKVMDNKYKTKKLQEARYFMALNFVLLKKFKEANALLKKIMADAQGKNYKIYVYQFYFSYKKNDLIDKYFIAFDLAQYTLNYLNENPVYNENYLPSFIEYLKKFITR
jgi:hypothetical protein